jgi:hypothetical protein
MWYTTYYKKNTPPLEYNEKYCEWMEEVETIVYKKLNRRLLDLPDQMYMHYFENSLDSEDMAEIIFEDLLMDLSDEEDE